ncbi:hypothetical protein AgCh_000774 [Apium graveolens]
MTMSPSVASGTLSTGIKGKGKLPLTSNDENLATQKDKHSHGTSTNTIQNISRNLGSEFADVDENNIYYTTDDNENFGPDIDTDGDDLSNDGHSDYLFSNDSDGGTDLENEDISENINPPRNVDIDYVRDTSPTSNTLNPPVGQTLRLGGRMYQQFIVDAFSAVEQSRLCTDCTDSANVGQGFISPSSFVGSASSLNGIVAEDKHVQQEDWSTADWSGSCAQNTQLDCENGDGFVKVSGVKLLDIDTGGVLTVSKLQTDVMKDLAVLTTIGMEGIPLASREAAVSRMPSMIERKATVAEEESSVIIFVVDVTAVDSGSKALEFLELHEDDEQISPSKAFTSPINQQEMAVNLIITDYCMPGMTGYDLLKKMKESSFRDMPVLIILSLDV